MTQCGSSDNGGHVVAAAYAVGAGAADAAVWRIDDIAAEGHHYERTRIVSTTAVTSTEAEQEALWWNGWKVR